MVAVNKDIVQFSKIVSHDLQEPIRKIRLFANMLETKLPQRSEASGRPVLEKIQSSADRLAHLTTALQQYVNIDLAGDKRETDLNEVLAAASEKATRARAFTALHLNTEPLPTIEGYLALIKKIVDNHNGTIWIESKPGSGTRVYIVLPLRSSQTSS